MAGAGCREAGPVDTIVEQRVVVVTAAIAAVTGRRKAGQVDTIVAQLVVVTEAVTIDGWGAAVVTIMDDLDMTGAVETGLGINLKQPKGLIMFPSLSI